MPASSSEERHQQLQSRLALLEAKYEQLLGHMAQYHEVAEQMEGKNKVGRGPRDINRPSTC